MILNKEKLNQIRCEFRRIFPDYIICISQEKDCFIEKGNHTMRISLEMLIDLPVEQLIELIVDLTKKRIKEI